jgi:aminoglycoside 6'-N-acetyltransferase
MLLSSARKDFRRARQAGTHLSPLTPSHESSIALGGGAIRFRALDRADYTLLADWFGRGHVAPWWRESADLAEIEARYGPTIDGHDPSEVFVVELADEPIGLIQRYLVDDDPEWARALAAAHPPAPSAGIDYLIGEQALTGTGLGPRVITAFLENTWRRYPTIVAVVVAVQQTNRRSWRALEKSGFHRIWAGELDSDDPSDRGQSYVYLHERPVETGPAPTNTGHPRHGEPDG